MPNDPQRTHAAEPVTSAMRARTPHELAAQLLRDAGSLELTGASFEKDCRFYAVVALNLREAVVWLQNWQPTIDGLHDAHLKELAQVSRAAREDCAGIAREVRDLVGDVRGERAEAWRSAGDTVVNVILACRQVQG